MSPDSWLATGHHLAWQGHRLFYRIEPGTGPTVLFLHGFPTSSWDFDPLWEVLGSSVHRITLDFLGFGDSSKPNHRQYSIEQQADAVEALVAALALNDVHVVCHDYAVSVGQELIARQIDRGQGLWRSCVFLNGGLFPETHRALWIQKLLLSPLGPLVTRGLGPAAFARSLSRVFGPQTPPSDDFLAGSWQLIERHQGRHVFHNLITYMRDRRQHRARWVAALQQSPLPIALVNGSLDPVSGAHLVARYQALGCRLDQLTTLPHIGHYPQVEDPATVAAACLRFWATVTP